ncbi:MAG: ATP-grasp domain-containing protein [Actinomycetota bacterium]|nr:ATP-grasp domain-containing protein [Actinomycetota bacterium]
MKLDATRRPWSGVHVGVFVEARYRTQTQPAGLTGALQARGHRVRLIEADEAGFRVGDVKWMDQLDVVVARGRSPQLLALVGWAERIGMPTINRRDAIARVLNKVEMSSALAHAGLSIPSTFVAPIEMLARKVPEDAFPLVLKPIFGDNARGLRIVHTRQELTAVEWPDAVAIAQEFLTSDGFDLKLYGIGERLFVVRKASPLSPTAQREGDVGHLMPTTPELEKLGRACMDLFGLELYGVDCIETADGPVVIEVNDFPNYSAVPKSSDLLADHVLSRARAWSRP